MGILDVLWRVPGAVLAASREVIGGSPSEPAAAGPDTPTPEAVMQLAAEAAQAGARVLAQVQEFSARLEAVEQSIDGFDQAAGEVEKIAAHCDEQLEKLELKRRTLAGYVSRLKKADPSWDESQVEQQQQQPGVSNLDDARRVARERGYGTR